MGLLFRREWMGVEPTAARSARPATDFEDQGTHQGTTTPLNRREYSGITPAWQPSLPAQKSAAVLDSSPLFG